MSTNGDARATALAHMLLKVADIDRSERFYVDLLGFKVRPAKPLADGRPFVPFTQGIALTVGGPKNSPQIDHIAFKAKTRKAVDEFYAAALKAGGKDNGSPGLRPHYHENYYGAFVFDPDGHNIEAVCHLPK